MKKNRIGILLILAPATLSGCSAAKEAGHAQCKDAASTQEYSVKWQDDLAAARHPGRLTMEQVVNAQGKSYGKLGLLKDSRWAEFCNALDAARKEANF
jgi:hypothetical protein